MDELKKMKQIKSTQLKIIETNKELQKKNLELEAKFNEINKTSHSKNTNEKFKKLFKLSKT